MLNFMIHFSNHNIDVIIKINNWWTILLGKFVEWLIMHAAHAYIMMMILVFNFSWWWVFSIFFWVWLWWWVCFSIPGSWIQYGPWIFLEAHIGARTYQLNNSLSKMNKDKGQKQKGMKERKWTKTNRSLHIFTFW